MREWRINMSTWGISRWELAELKAFCRQYPEKKEQADSLLGVRSTSHVVEYSVGEGDDKKILGTVLPRGNSGSNPVEDTAMKRIRLLEDCDLIDRVAKSVDGGGWERALILNCCYGIGYADIDPKLLPTSHRNAFFQAKREFYVLLNYERILHRNLVHTGQCK